MMRVALLAAICAVVGPAASAQPSQSPVIHHDLVVTLDPGLAFGTGSHPSTALCLEWLDANLPSGTRWPSNPHHGPHTLSRLLHQKLLQ
jgi:hypothetical protein